MTGRRPRTPSRPPSRPPRSRLRLAARAAVGGGVVLPLGLGLWETLRAAFGVVPALGFGPASLAPWRALFDQPGLATSLRLTLVTGFGATLAALALALGFCALVQRRAAERGAGRLILPLLAAPHAAVAIGLAFLIAPSGWIARLISPGLSGWSDPPALATVNDGWGLALMLGLVIKEVPFLILVTLMALGQVPVRALMATGRSLGHGPGAVWVGVILPRIYPMIRLPVWAVLAFSLSVVDMAIVLGPSNPPVLAVAVLRRFADPDLAALLPGSAGAVAQALVVAAGIALWHGGERLAARLWRWRGARGPRGGAAEAPLAGLAAAAVSGLATGIAALACLGLWSFAQRWNFPRDLPEIWTLSAWITIGGWRDAAATTLLIGAASALLSLALAVAWLEGDDRSPRSGGRAAAALIWLPLFVPQVASVYGLNVVFLRLGLSGGPAAVIWAHVVFVFPYVLLALSGPWHRLDRRLVATAAALGAGPGRRLWSVKLPALIRPVLVAAAIGFAVSVAQYLPTLLPGAGRVATLTTEAVALSSGADRRLAAVHGVVQAALPLAVYGLAVLLPGLPARRRRRAGTIAGVA